MALNKLTAILCLSSTFAFSPSQTGRPENLVGESLPQRLLRREALPPEKIRDGMTRGNRDAPDMAMPRCFVEYDFFRKPPGGPKECAALSAQVPDGDEALLDATRGASCFNIDDESSHFNLPIRRLEQGTPFTFMRYNDGEWFAMQDLLQHPSGDWMCRNCDKLPCSRRMVEAFMHALQDEEFAKASPPHGLSYVFQASLYWGGWKEDMKAWGIRPSIVTNDFFHSYVRSSSPMFLESFVKSLQRYKVTIVGPCMLRRLCSKVPYSAFVEIPAQHCSVADVDKTLDSVHSLLANQMQLSSTPIVILISASMMTKALGAMLFPNSKDRHFVIDVGSAFDPLFDPIGQESITKRRIATQGVRNRFEQPSADVLAALAGPKKLYQSRAEALKGLAGWSFGATGGTACASRCEHAAPQCGD